MWHFSLDHLIGKINVIIYEIFVANNYGHINIVQYFCYTDPDVDIKGPFLIKNPSTATIYLKVGPKSKSRESRTIDATTNEKDASHFYVKYVKKYGQYFEVFYDDGDNQLFLSAAKDDRHDNRSRTLQVGNDAGGAWSYLSLCNEKLKNQMDGSKEVKHSPSVATSSQLKQQREMRASSLFADQQSWGKHAIPFAVCQGV